MKKAVIAVLCVLALAGCIPGYKEAKESGVTGRVISTNPTLSRVVDTEAGVVCYVTYSVYGVGVSCVPINQTTLEEGK